MILTMPPPEIDSKKWSQNMREFVKVCLTKDPKERPSAEDMMEHPFMKEPLAREQGKQELIMLIRKFQESSNQVESLFSKSASHIS